MAKKKGLVLGGGGSKGAYEIGVWRALRELDVQFDVITGTSIGALNGALMIQGDYEGAEEMWKNMRYEGVLGSVTAEELTTLDGTKQALTTALTEIIKDGGLDITPLETLVRTMLDEKAVRSSPIEFGIVTVQFPPLKEVALTKEQIPQGEMAEYLLASSACYPAFKRKEIGGNKYIDGGYRNNLPVDLAIDLGAQEIIAVDLEAIGFIPKVRHYRIPVTYIRSYWNLGIFISFNPERIARNMNLGYLDTMKQYGRYEGYAYAFYPGELQKNEEQYFAAWNELRRRLGFLGSDENANPIQKAMETRLKGALRRKGRRKADLRDYFLRAAEITGELLDLPPDVAYDFDTFNEKLLEQFHQVDVPDREKFEEALRNPSSIPKLARQISNFESEQLLSFLYGWIDEAATGKNPGHNLFWAAAAASRDFIAASYLYLLNHRLDLLPDQPAR